MPEASRILEHPLLVAHRGASGYHPEHTLPTYELAVRQGADYIEPDLQITRDGVLIALHDLTLDRTTNVEEVFPERFREESEGGEIVKRWYAVDFTLEEIKELDAGSWFDPRFEGVRIPAFSEVLQLALGRVGILPEIKEPQVYADEGFNMAQLLLDELKQFDLDRPEVNPGTPVMVQSFSEESLDHLRNGLGSRLPSLFLVSGSGAETWFSPEGLERVKSFANGIGPAKDLLLQDPERVRMAHEAGLTVIPWTFGAETPEAIYSLEEEMARFLCVLKVDGLFTDYPDQFPEPLNCPEEG